MKQNDEHGFCDWETSRRVPKMSPELYPTESNGVPLRYVYALEDPRTGRARYIGVTADPPRRLKEHVYNTGEHNPIKRDWVNWLKAAGLAPRMRVLSCVPLHKALDEEHRQIRLHREKFPDLLNTVGNGNRPASERDDPWLSDMLDSQEFHEHLANEIDEPCRRKPAPFTARYIGYVMELLERAERAAPLNTDPMGPEALQF